MLIQADNFSVEVDEKANTIHVRLRRNTRLATARFTFRNGDIVPIQGVVGRKNIVHLVLKITKEKADA